MARTNTTTFDCPIFSEGDEQFLKLFSFWVEGVLQTICAILGIFGNIIASIIITRKEMRNSFNLLLVSLACFDSTYLFGSILESIRKPNAFGFSSEVHVILFPYLLYPANQIAVSGSIFMTVAIAWERYIAVHYPLDYNQAMNDSNAVRKRLLKYVGPVLLLAIVFNLGKFFEGKVVYREIISPNNDGNHASVFSDIEIPRLLQNTEPQNFTLLSSNSSNNEVEHLGKENFSVNSLIDHYRVKKMIAELDITEFRKHPAYSMYLNWSRILVLGIIPFSLLVFFNSKIYTDINERRKRRLRISRPSVSNVLTDCVEVPSRRQSDFPLLSQSRKGSYGVALDEIKLQRIPSFPLKKRMSLTIGGTDFLKRFRSKHNEYQTDDEIKVTSQISKKVEKRGDGRKIEFTSFTSNTTNGSNKTNRTILTTDQHREPVSSCSIVSSGTSLPNTTDLKTRHNLGNGKANKERIQEAYNIETDSPSARIETSVAEHPLETSSNNRDKRNSRNKGRNSSTIPVVIVNNEESNAPRNIVKTKVQVGLSEDAASNYPLQENMCTDGNKITNPKKETLDYTTRRRSTIRFEKELQNECEIAKEMVLSPEIVVTGPDFDVSGRTAATVLTLAAAAASTTNNRLKLRHVQSINEKRRCFEDNLAAIFMGFVFVFLICHMPRLFLNIHELIVMKGAMECQYHRQEPFSMWSLILINVSHLLLVLNSSTNILVYCFMSSKFRKECSKFHHSFKTKTCCQKYKNTSSSYIMSPKRAHTVPKYASDPKQKKQYLKVPTRSNPLPSEIARSNV